MKLISLTNKKGDPWCTTYRFFKCIFQPIPCYALHYSFVQAWKILLFTVYFILSVKKNWWDFESPFVHLESHLAFILIFDSSSKNAPRLWFTAINFKRTVFFFFFFLEVVSWNHGNVFPCSPGQLWVKGRNSSLIFCRLSRL